MTKSLPLTELKRDRSQDKPLKVRCLYVFTCKGYNDINQLNKLVLSIISVNQTLETVKL